MVEHATENRGVVSSTLTLGTISNPECKPLVSTASVASKRIRAAVPESPRTLNRHRSYDSEECPGNAKGSNTDSRS